MYGLGAHEVTERIFGEGQYVTTEKARSSAIETSMAGDQAAGYTYVGKGVFDEFEGTHTVGFSAYNEKAALGKDSQGQDKKEWTGVKGRGTWGRMDTRGMSEQGAQEALSKFAPTGAVAVEATKAGNGILYRAASDIGGVTTTYKDLAEVLPGRFREGMYESKGGKVSMTGDMGGRMERYRLNGTGVILLPVISSRWAVLLMAVSV